MEYRPTAGQIQQVENHLRSFSDPLEIAEQMMLDRIKSGEWSVHEQRFVEHELLEADLMAGGVPWEKAHIKILEQQGIVYQPGYEAYLYHPSVILHPDCKAWFNKSAQELAHQMLNEGTA